MSVPTWRSEGFRVTLRAMTVDVLALRQAALSHLEAGDKAGAWAALEPVTLVALEGWCVGGGHSLHVVCDLSLASRQHARFKQTDADVASFDGGFGSAYLARQVGQKFAREIFFLAEEYSAQRAYEIGLINRLTDGVALEGALELAASITANGPLAVAASKRVIVESRDWSESDMWKKQTEALGNLFMSEDAREGAAAFAQKRKPEWKGR